MGSLFRSTVIKGNRLTDFTNTTATVGVPMPWGYGRYPVDGNVIWAPLPPKEQVKRTRQGKGGVKQETYTYTLSYSVAFGCRRIYGYWWIKRNGKVVYTRDPNAPAEDLAYAAKWLQKATLYDGLPNEMPDSTIESYEGSGQVSAFRNVPKIVLEDDDVTEGGGAVPSYEACVIASPPEAYLTSHPYTQYDDGSFDIEPFFVDASTRNLQIQYDMEPEAVVLEPFYVAARTTDGLYIHAQPPEPMEVVPTFVSAFTKAVQITHTQPPEAITRAPVFSAASTKNILVTHNTQPPEAITRAPIFVSAMTQVP